MTPQAASTRLITRRKHDAFGRRNAGEIVAGRGDHDDAAVVGKVDRIDQRARR